MASLYQTAKRSRRIVLFFVLLAVLLTAYDFWNSLQSDSVIVSNDASRFYMNPDQAFGELPIPDITAIERDTNDQVTYAINGAFETFPDVAYVYTIEEPQEKLLTFENAQDAVDRLGFEQTQFTNVSGNLFRWEKQGLGVDVTFDSVLQEWNLQTDFAFSPLLQVVASTDQNESTYVSSGRTIVNSLNFDSLGLLDGDIIPTYSFFGTDGIFYEAEQSQSEYVFIDIFRQLPFADLKPSAELPTLQPGQSIPDEIDSLVYKNDPRQGSARFIVKENGRDLDEDVLFIDYTNFEYVTTAGSYLIITPDEAWSNIQSGQGSLVLIQQSGDTSLDTSTPLNVRRFVAEAPQTEVGYFEPESWETYVYPIYIFRGTAELEDGRLANFVFYIDAIKRIL